MLRPACVGMVSEVACARNARQRSTVRSSSRSISATESDISATRMARRWRGERDAGERARLVRPARQRPPARGRASPARRSSAATSRSTRVRPDALEQALAHQARQLARHLLARGADAAGDVLVRRRRLEARAVVLDAGDAREAQQLEPDAALHRLRAEVEQAVGELAHRAGQAAQQALAHRGVVGEDGAERLGRHRGEQRFAQRHDVGEARVAVDRRVLAEQLARGEVAEDDAPAAPGVARRRAPWPAITKYTSRSVPSRRITYSLRLQRVQLHCAAISRSV